MKAIKEWGPLLIPGVLLLFAWVFQKDFFLQLSENSHFWPWFIVLASLTSVVIATFFFEKLPEEVILFLIFTGVASNLLPGTISSPLFWLSFFGYILIMLTWMAGFFTRDFRLSRIEAIRFSVGLIRIIWHLFQRNRSLNESVIKLAENSMRYIPPRDDSEFVDSIRTFLLIALGDAYLGLPTDNDDGNLKQANERYNAISWRYYESEAVSYVKYKQGNLYSKLSGGDRGENLYKAIDCYKTVLQHADSLELATYLATLQNLGSAFLNLTTGERTYNLSQSIAYYEKALSLSKVESKPHAEHNGFLIKLLAPRIDRISHAEIYMNLGTASLGMSDASNISHVPQAINYYQQALDYSTLDIDPLFYALLQHKLGNAYSRLQTDSQLSHIKQAIECYHEALLFCYPEVAPIEYANIQADLGKAYHSLFIKEGTDLFQKYALDSYHEALRFFTQDSAPFECRQVNHDLGDLYLKQSNWESAIVYYSAAIQVDQQLYKTSLFNKDKAKDSAKNAALYHKCAFVAAQSEKPLEALAILERGKSRVLAEALQLHTSRPQNISIEVWEEFEEASKSLHTVWKQGWSLPDNENDLLHVYEKRTNKVREATKTFDIALEKIREKLPEFLQENDFTIFDSVLMDESAVLITFSITEQGSIGFIVSRCQNEGLVDFTVQTINLSNITKKALDIVIQKYVKALQEISQSIRDSSNNNNKQWLITLEQVIDEISKNLLNPTLSKLSEKIKTVVFSPTSELSILPLHATWREINGHKQYLIDDFEIIFAPSVYAFSVSQQRARELQNYIPSLLAIINPTKDLDFAATEGESVANLFASQAQTLLYEGKACKQNILELHSKHTIWHFVCHGYYDWQDPLNSHLVLANDEKLTLANVISELDLSTTRLVTMSACETGLTDIYQWANEYIGLPAGFLQAGVPATVSTLWPVNDHSTSLLMEHFYYNHFVNGMALSQALRQAQLWLRNATRKKIAEYYESKKAHQMYLNIVFDGDGLDEKPYSHPHYWAAFTFTGN